LIFSVCMFNFPVLSLCSFQKRVYAHLSLLLLILTRLDELIWLLSIGNW
jgi:hypothetical protein